MKLYNTLLFNKLGLRISVFFVLVFLFGALFVNVRVSLAGSLSHDLLIDDELRWVFANNQFDNGAIGMNGKGWVVPYFSSIFCIHALKSEPSSAPYVKKYIQWYFANINTTPDRDGLIGTIYDYCAGDRGLLPCFAYNSSNRLYDSVDSYAALFFSLLRTYWDVTHDTYLLLSNRSKVELVYGALNSVMNQNGLSSALRNWPDQYAMDNFEVNIGLRDLEYIYRNVFNDISFADTIKQVYEKNRLAIESILYDGNYKVYRVSQNMRFQDYKWTTVYPDALVPVLGIASGYLNPSLEKTRYLFGQFVSYHPRWVQSLFYVNSQYWAYTMVAYAAALMGDFGSVKLYDYNFRREWFVNRNRQWSYTTIDAAFYIAYHDVLRKAGQSVFVSDFNSNNKVDIFDYNILVTNFGKTGNAGWIPADINKDGKVDIFDYNILVSEFGR